MGFKAGQNRYTLDFTGTPYATPDDGDPLKVVMTGLSMAESLSTVEMEEKFQLAKASGNPRDVVAAVREIVGVFAPHLVSWNLEDASSGDPITADEAGLLAQDPVFVFDIVKAWRTAVMEVPTDLKAGSNSGGSTKMEEQLAKQTPTPSPSSSPAPNSSSGTVKDSGASPGSSTPNPVSS